MGNVSSAEKTWRPSPGRGGSDRLPAASGAYEPVTPGVGRERLPTGSGLRAIVTRHHLQARAARGQMELALDAAGWPWSRRLSLWIDALVVLEEGDG